MTLKPYLAIARVDHWFKNVFVLPGLVAALFATDDYEVLTVLLVSFAGMAATCFAASHAATALSAD